MKPLNFWLPRDGYDREIIIPGEYVESIMLPAAEHETGHIIAAHSLGARVLGIAVGFIPDKNQEGMFLQALHEWDNSSIEAECIIKAAGAAADILYQGGYNERAASGDLQDLEALTGKASFEPYLEKAQDILRQHEREFKSVVDLLKASLDVPEHRTLGILPNHRIGILLVDEAQLLTRLRCATPKKPGRN